MVFNVLIEGLQFRGDADSSAGFTISPDGWTGWEDSVEVRGDSVARPQGDGDYDTPTTLGTRIVSISGTCWAESEEKTAHLGSRLKGLLAGGASGVMTVDHYGSKLWARGKLAPGVKTLFQARGYDPRIADFQIQLKFTDPYRYGETTTFAAEAGTPLVVKAFHRGNYFAYPILTITGSMPSYSVSSGGKTYQVLTPVTSGHPHQIFMDTGLLVIDGSPRYNLPGSRQTWRIPAGTEVTQTLAPAGGTGAMTVTVPDTSN